MDPGRRDQRIVFERVATTTNDYGEKIAGAATEIAVAWAQVRWGTGQERREAAQEGAVQVATFICDRNPTLDTVQATDRIVFHGAWDITGIAPMSRSEIHFTATRRA